MCQKNKLILLLLGALLGVLPLLLAPDQFLEIIHNGATQQYSQIDLIKLILIYPILEEFVFRGKLWSFCDELVRFHPHRHLLVNISTTVLFTATHILFRGYELLWVFPISIYLGLLRQYSANFIVPMVVHIFWNGFWFLVLL